jgi:alpha-methylacyl-CoA racemase
MREGQQPMNKPTSPRGGPLHGVRVVEFAGLGPAPFACMLLADMGADVVRIDRPDAPPIDARDIVNRGRRTVALDLKSP